MLGSIFKKASAQPECTEPWRGSLGLAPSRKRDQYRYVQKSFNACFYNHTFCLKSTADHLQYPPPLKPSPGLVSPEGWNLLLWALWTLKMEAFLRFSSIFRVKSMQLIANGRWIMQPNQMVYVEYFNFALCLLWNFFENALKLSFIDSTAGFVSQLARKKARAAGARSNRI